MDAFEAVRAYMAAQGMSVSGARVLAACSGGADSVALLHLLCRMEGVTVVCAHFNHCLRGTESDRDEEFVRMLCARWGLELRSGRADVGAYASAHRLGTEEAARTLRYRFLEAAADEAGCAFIATAHTASDNAETVLFHLIRGAGTLGLCGIPPVRGRLLRPLLCLSRADVEAYLSEQGLGHVEDSSNADLRCSRNALRHAVLPELERIHPGALAHINAAAALLREDEDYLGSLARDFLSGQSPERGLEVSALLALPRPVALRALRTAASSPGRAHLERLYEALCRNKTGRTRLSLPGTEALAEHGFLRFSPAPPEPDPIPRRPVAAGGSTRIPERGAVIFCREDPAGQEIHNSFNTFYFKSEKICDTLFVASRAAGDRIRLAGRGCTKTLRQLYKEARLSPGERQRRLVFSDASGVVAVEGFGVAERCAPEPGTPTLILELLTLNS